MLLAALSGAWQARHRQCMSAAPAKNAAGQDRQKLNMIIKKRAPVNRIDIPSFLLSYLRVGDVKSL